MHHSVSNLVPQKQCFKNWCWAAVTCMVANHYDTALTRAQCQVVQRRLFTPNGPPCCDGTSKDCPKNKENNSAWQKKWNSICEIQTVPDLAPYLGPKDQPQHPQYELIRQEINGDRPVICELSSGVGRHVILIIGYDDAAGPEGPTALTLIDPQSGSELHTPYSQLANTVIEGSSWVSTTLTRPAAAPGSLIV